MRVWDTPNPLQTSLLWFCLDDWDNWAYNVAQSGMCGFFFACFYGVWSTI